MKLIVLFCIVSAVVALPRTKQTAEVYREPLELESDAEPVDIGNFDDQNPEGDAESIPGTNFFVLRFRPFFHSFGFPEFRPQLPQLPRLPDFPALPPRRSFFDDFFSRDYQPEPEQPEIPEPNPFFKTFFDMMKPSGFGGPNFDSLPGNYSNSTHDIMDIDGTKVAVNQTIKKTSGNNFHNFFHFKVVQVLPDGEILAEETPGEEQPVVDEISPEQDAGFDGDLPEEDITVDEPLPEDTRAVEEVLPESDPEIVMRRGDTTFDPEANQYDFERDPQRENEVVPVENYAPEFADSSNIEVAYLRDQPIRRARSSSKKNSYSSWLNRKPAYDLSSDTRVNRIVSSKQQTFSRVDPDAEVFDLELIIREQEGKNEP